MAGGSPTLLALAVLVLNDHWLKQAAPGVVTGKLSDVAGLVLAPALLAVVLALLRVPRAAPVALVATAVGYTVVKTTVGASRRPTPCCQRSAGPRRCCATPPT